MKTPEFQFSADVLEKSERFRSLGPFPRHRNETQEDYEQRRKLAWVNRCVDRDAALRELHEAFGASRNLRISSKRVPLAALVFGSYGEADWGELTPEIASIEETALMVVTYRGSGAGMRLPAQLYHVPLQRRVVERACATMRAWGARPTVLPFSFVNPRGCHAVYVVAAESPRGKKERDDD